MDDNIIKQVADQLLNAIEKEIPNFQGFDDPRFIEREITYKKRIIHDAKKQLSSETIRKLVVDENYKSVYNRILSVGQHKDNNLLYNKVPRSGDLALLFNENLDYKSFTEAIAHLVIHHWDETGGDKVDLFCNWAEEQGLPIKWTFITYYLFVSNPDEELFVKPTVMKEFLKMLGKGDLWHHRPTGELYKTIKDDLRAVGEELPFEIKRGFLDLQGFLWTALASKDQKLTKAKEYLEIYSGEADTHLSGQAAFLEPRHNYFQEFFKKDHLKNAEWSDFQEMGEMIHALATNRIAYKNAFGNPNHEIEHYRKVFLYLAYGEDDLSDRINAVLNKESEYYVKYLAESFYGELIGYVFPSEYVFYNRRDKEAIKFLELNINQKRGESFGEFFLRYNERIKPLFELYKDIVGQRTETTLPLELDQFFSWLYDNHITEESNAKQHISSEDERNYWVFQGNPDTYNLIEALKHNAVKRWTVNAHKDKIKVGDKVMLWKTGQNAGCYALAEIEKAPALITDSDEELKY